MEGRQQSVRFRVREASSRDVEAIVHLIDLLMAHHGATSAEPGQLARAVRRVIESGSDLFLVVETDGQIVGTVQVQRRFSTWQAAEYLFLEDFAVLPAWRSRGAGAAMLAAVAERGRAAGAAAIRLDLHETNDRARTFYRREGFTDTGYRTLDRPL